MESHDQLREEVQVICADCRLPIAGSKPRTDVTRYLSETSRCQCNRADSAQGTDGAPPESRSRVGIKLQISISMEDAAEILGDRYEIMAFLGQGGMGSVFKVRDRELQTILAVKILNPNLVQHEDSVKRFDLEARASMQLTDPHLAAVYSYGMGKNQTPYLVMDYLEGTTMDHLLKQQNHLDPGRALDLFIQICQGLEQSHSKGVVHRDIKPSNVMITHPSPGVEFAKIFDFGIAKVMPNQAIDLTGDLTITGELLGSPLYMAPEQCQEGVVDQRTDVHSLGCLMYKTLTGVHPFEGKNILETVSRIITAPAPSLQEVRPDLKLSSSLNAVVLKCLEKKSENRYQTVAALKSELELIRDGKKPVVTEVALKRARRENTTSIVLISVICLLGLAAVTLTLLFNCFPSSRPMPPVTSPATIPTDVYQDAERLDQLSYTYFAQGDYERAIPLLEFGIKTYKANGKKMVGAGREDNYLAENLSHLGKCYLMLHKYREAQAPYRESLKMFQRWGNYPGGMMSEAVYDYASVLTASGRKAEADSMLSDYKRNNNLTTIP